MYLKANIFYLQNENYFEIAEEFDPEKEKLWRGWYLFLNEFKCRIQI